MRRVRRFPHFKLNAPWNSLPRTTLHSAANGQMSAEEQMAKRDGTQAGDPVQGVGAKYHFAVTKELLLRLIMEMDA